MVAGEQRQGISFQLPAAEKVTKVILHLGTIELDALMQAGGH
jgi:hypothetical protein